MLSWQFLFDPTIEFCICYATYSSFCTKILTELAYIYLSTYYFDVLSGNRYYVDFFLVNNQIFADSFFIFLKIFLLILSVQIWLCSILLVLTTDELLCFTRICFKEKTLYIEYGVEFVRDFHLESAGPTYVSGCAIVGSYAAKSIRIRDGVWKPDQLFVFFFCYETTIKCVVAIIFIPS